MEENGPSTSSGTFVVYPNPANNTLNINAGNAKFAYVLFNGMGQAVAKGNAHGVAQVNVESMAKGIYFLRITSNQQIHVEKIIVE